MKQKRAPELADITAQKRSESDAALYLFDGSISVWVPKSLVEDNRDGTFTMPFWLAKEKRLI